jgi:hypothetical protein
MKNTKMLTIFSFIYITIDNKQKNIYENLKKDNYFSCFNNLITHINHKFSSFVIKLTFKS